MTDRSQWRPLSPAFTAAVREYDRTSRARLLAREARDAVTAPLYHYTDAGGLKGIITEQQVWFTHWRHLNDPTEMQFGMDIAKAVLAEVGTRLGQKIKIFCDMVEDLFSADNMHATFELYVASFSRARDDLNQWRVYAAKGQGFALGLAPSLFGIEGKRDRKPHENVFVAPVTYGPVAGRLLHLTPIERAAQIVAQTVTRKAQAMSDINRGMPFFDEMGKVLIASELLLNCLTMKDSQHEAEQEVRQFIVGEIAKLAPHVSTRMRDKETVPFIKGDMPIQEPGRIVEIVIGPAAPPDAEDFACALLAAFHPNPASILRRSSIPPSLFAVLTSGGAIRV
jgi:hypothetical protein